jgi:hypothetical protein
MIARRMWIVSAVAAYAVAGPALADTAFPGFWRVFQAAVVKHNMPAIARMTRLPFYLDRTISRRAALPKALAGLFDAAARECFAKATPVRDGNYYSVTCGNTQFGFDANEGKWEFSGITLH